MIEHVTEEFLRLIKLPDHSKKQLNYLIVMPRIALHDNATYQLPYGLCMVSSAFKASGRNVISLNLNYKKDISSLLRSVIEENSIDVVATGGLSGQFLAIKEITDAVKQINPRVITIVGGGIITAEPYVALLGLETADYGIIGEGEITINELGYALENDIRPSIVEGVVCKSSIGGGTGFVLKSKILIYFLFLIMTVLNTISLSIKKCLLNWQQLVPKQLSFLQVVLVRLTARFVFTPVEKSTGNVLLIMF